MKFSFKKNIIIIVIAAVLAIGAGVGAVAIGVSNSPANRVSRYMGAAERYLSELDYEQAIIEFDRILEIDPMNVEAYLGKAQAYLALGDTENALKWLEKGLEMTGDRRLQEKIDEINNKPETPEESSSSVPVESEPEEIPQYEHEEVANMLLNYFNGTGEVDKDMLKSIKTFGVKANGFDIILLSDEDWHIGATSKTFTINDDKFFIPFSFNSFEKLNIISGMTNCFGVYIDGLTIVDYSIFTNIQSLHLYNCSINDVTPLGSLTNLSRLSLCSNPITDISPLENLTNLSVLYLDGNMISDISPLSNLTNLRTLGLFGNKITDISSLANLTNLTWLNLGGNQISDISSLANLTNLTYLYLYGNQISDISPLANLTNLTELELYGNQISDISPLAKLTNLTRLSLYSNQITDADLARLKQQLPNCEIIF